MTREQALQRLEHTSGFTFVGGRVVITDQRTLATVAELGKGTVMRGAGRPSSKRPEPTNPRSFA